MDRQYYQEHALTRHLSETDERLMVRLQAFALHAHEALSFSREVSAEEEPALWLKGLTGAVDLWIEVGQPDEKIICQACGRAKRRRWSRIVRRSSTVNVRQAPTMQLQCTIQEGQIWMADGANSTHDIDDFERCSAPFGQ